MKGSPSLISTSGNSFWASNNDCVILGHCHRRRASGTDFSSALKMGINMKTNYKLLILSIATVVLLSCLAGTSSVEPFSVVDGRVHILDTGLSFELPKETWSADSGKYQSNGELQLVSFSRNDPISFGNGQAYFPNISIIVEKLDQEMTIESYDEFVRDSITTAGMEIKSLEPLSESEFLLPPTKAIGWATLVSTAQGDSQGYMINIVHRNYGIRMILESGLGNFDIISAEYLEVIKSLELK